MKIATGQYPSVVGDVEQNVATAVEAVAAAAGARVLVMPELFLTGYTMASHAICTDDPRLAPLDDAATQAGMTVLVGAALRGPRRPTISLLAIGNGVRHVYDKLHLCGTEQDHFAPGERPVVIEIDGWKLGLAICYDGCFPEHARAVADAGADAYVASVAYYVGSAHRRELYYRARALDNGFFCIVSGLSGCCDDADFDGGSAIIDPEGRVLASALPDSAGVVMIDLDKDVIRTTREAHPMLAERQSFAAVEQTLCL